jgi:hypothetical protein
MFLFILKARPCFYLINSELQSTFQINMDFCGGGPTKKICKMCDGVIEKNPDSVTCEGFISKCTFVD